MGEGRREAGEQTGSERRLIVSEAADALGISSEAVRTRIVRGTLRSVKEKGRVFVLFDADETQPNTDRTKDQTSDQTALVEVLREALDREREANRENRRIIAGLIERIPALEASQEASESPETVGEEPEAAGHAPVQYRRPSDGSSARTERDLGRLAAAPLREVIGPYLCIIGVWT